MKQNDPMYIIDELAEQAGGYFAMPFQTPSQILCKPLEGVK